MPRELFHCRPCNDHFSLTEDENEPFIHLASRGPIGLSASSCRDLAENLLRAARTLDRRTGGKTPSLEDSIARLKASGDRLEDFLNDEVEEAVLMGGHGPHVTTCITTSDV